MARAWWIVCGCRSASPWWLGSGIRGQKFRVLYGIRFVRVRSGRWLLCEHANYRGRCQELAPSGRCEPLERYGLDNKVSSLKRVKGTTRVSFRDPKIEGHALDYCREWGRNCGKPAADAFCRSRGYLRADSFRVRRGSPPTMTIGDRKLCRASHCDRISEVVCAVE